MGGGPAVYIAARCSGGPPEVGFGRVVGRLAPLMVRFRRHDGEEREMPLVALTPITEDDYAKVEAADGDPQKAFGVAITTPPEAHHFVQHLTRRWITSD